jgi:hypothetical protein
VRGGQSLVLSERNSPSAWKPEEGAWQEGRQGVTKDTKQKARTRSCPLLAIRGAADQAFLVFLPSSFASFVTPWLASVRQAQTAGFQVHRVKQKTCFRWHRAVVRAGLAQPCRPPQKNSIRLDKALDAIPFNN